MTEKVMDFSDMVVKENLDFQIGVGNGNVLDDGNFQFSVGFLVNGVVMFSSDGWRVIKRTGRLVPPARRVANRLGYASFVPMVGVDVDLVEELKRLVKAAFPHVTVN